MHEYGLILFLALGFAIALVFGYTTQRLRLSPILGYLIAGIVVGPFSPGLSVDGELAAQLAEVGVILLMFGVGLHFHLQDLLAVKWIAIPGAVGQSVVATVLVTLIAHFMGWDWSAGLIMGISVAVASTVVLIRVLSDNNVIDTSQGHIAVGWLIVEDIFTVLVLVLLPALGNIFSGQETVGAESGLKSVFITLVVALGKIAVLGGVVLWGGGKLIPWLLTQIARTRSRELFTLAVLAFALLIASVSAFIFGASMALGAFLAGMVVGQSRLSEQAAADALPMKDAFAVIFFVSVGMLFNPYTLLENLPLFLVLMAIILFAKPLTALLIVVIRGYSSSTAFTVAIGLAQIGEFSFILSGEARKLGLLPEVGESMLVAAAIFSIALNPLFFKAVPKMEQYLRKNPKLWQLLNRKAVKRGQKANEEAAHRLQAASAQDKAVIIGYGPVGRTITRLLQQSGVHPVIIDLNADTVARIHEQGFNAIFGDASKMDILKAAGIERAKYLIVTPPDIGVRIPVITTAKRLNENIIIYSRARYIAERSILEQLGVTQVCYEETESAVTIAKMILKNEGLEKSQISAEIKSIRAEFLVEHPISKEK